MRGRPFSSRSGRGGVRPVMGPCPVCVGKGGHNDCKVCNGKGVVYGTIAR
jgi:DnaJ-class molecular chaperone